MNIYSNILNRYFDYKGQAWQVISHLHSMGGYSDNGNGECFRECQNLKTGKVIRLNYQEFWNVIPRGYSHNGNVTAQNQ